MDAVHRIFYGWAIVLLWLGYNACMHVCVCVCQRQSKYQTAVLDLGECSR